LTTGYLMVLWSWHADVKALVRMTGWAPFDLDGPQSVSANF
jgi:hypothetical protein